MSVAELPLSIVPLSKKVYRDLFEFEQFNWDYFAQAVGVRPDSYRQYESFCLEQDERLDQQAAHQMASYVLYTDDKLIGRVNLSNINDYSASLGYRICQSVIGRGVATLAVSNILAIAKALGLKQLNAIVVDINPASEKVLLNNEFAYSHTEKDVLHFDNTRVNYKHYGKRL